ncbi:MAG: hypothetical protein ACR2K6_01955 [Solirubrobacterales bacterium]
MRTGRWGGALAGLIVAVGWMAAAAAAELEDFFGTWRGEALAETRGDVVEPITTRDLDVSIVPEGEADGFTVTWSTVLRAGEGDGARKTASRTFRPSGRPGIWRTRGPGDPMRQAGYAWARLMDQTLSVYTLTITDTGGYEMHVYDREIDGDAMTLRFTRLEDGRVLRLVSGRLRRQ